uniref:HDC05459 n=1 Tax=Drosophila melanogaster TaxID=7227 RepID=Q6IGS4_DROME|nr:TPA_inf: HDC05459 [Drosophila melanogaster]
MLRIRSIFPHLLAISDFVPHPIVRAQDPNPAAGAGVETGAGATARLTTSEAEVAESARGKDEGRRRWEWRKDTPIDNARADINLSQIRGSRVSFRIPDSAPLPKCQDKSINF